MSLRAALETGFFNNHGGHLAFGLDLERRLSTKEKQTLIEEQVAIFKDLALSALSVLDHQIKKERRDPRYKDGIRGYGKCAKIYDLVYGLILVLLTTLLFTNQLSFVTFGKMIIAASTINLFVQLGEPFLLFKCATDTTDPYEGIYQSIQQRIRQELDPEKKATEIAVSIDKLPLHESEKTAIRSKIHDFCQSEGLYKIFDNYPHPPKEVMPNQPPSILGWKEGASLIHTLAIIVFVTLTLLNVTEINLSKYVIVGVMPLGLISSFFLQDTLEKRLLKPCEEQILDPKEAAQIKQRLTHKIHQICA